MADGTANLQLSFAIKIGSRRFVTTHVMFQPQGPNYLFRHSSYLPCLSPNSLISNVYLSLNSHSLNSIMVILQLVLLCRTIKLTSGQWHENASKGTCHISEDTSDCISSWWNTELWANFLLRLPVILVVVRLVITGCLTYVTTNKPIFGLNAGLKKNQNSFNLVRLRSCV